MRVSALTAILGGLVLTAVAVSNPAAADAKKGGLCHVVCSETPAPASMRPAPVKHAPMHIVRRHVARHRMHHYAEHNYYNYREAERTETDFRSEWHQAPNDAMVPGYYQQGGYCGCDTMGGGVAGAGLQIDRYGWTGGVGYAAAGGEFVDGYGMVHFGGGFQNGPTYNSYGQSFQFNPSRPGPFQPRVMGGFAAGGRVSGGFGFRR